MIQHPLTIDAQDVQIDACGHYDDDSGELDHLTINGCYVCVSDIHAALRLLDNETYCPNWALPLDVEKLDATLNDEQADWLDDKRG